MNVIGLVAKRRFYGIFSTFRLFNPSTQRFFNSPLFFLLLLLLAFLLQPPTCDAALDFLSLNFSNFTFSNFFGFFSRRFISVLRRHLFLLVVVYAVISFLNTFSFGIASSAFLNAKACS